MSVRRLTIDELLERARSRLDRLTPQQAATAAAGDALLIDIRLESQRERDGLIPGALFCPRNVLEWRVDPSSGWQHAAIGGLDRQLILVCDEGYQSSLAAAAVLDLGFERATDLVGGFQGWRAAGLPVEPPHRTQRQPAADRPLERPDGPRDPRGAAVQPPEPNGFRAGNTGSSAIHAAP